MRKNPLETADLFIFTKDISENSFFVQCISSNHFLLRTERNKTPNFQEKQGN